MCNIRLRHIVTLLLCCLFSSAAWAFEPCASAAREQYVPVEARYTTGLIFKIEQCGKEPSYLFGTMHTDDPANNHITNKAAGLLADAERAGFEIIPTETDAATMQHFMFFDDNTTLSSLIGDSAFSQLSHILNSTRPMARPQMERLKPWAANVMLQLPPMKGDGLSIDEKLTHFATEQKKPLFALETMAEQLRIFDDMPMQTQISMLKDSLTNYAIITETTKKLSDAYLDQNLNAIARLGEEGFTEITDAALRDELKRKLITERNHKMAESLKPVLFQGDSFVAVGALHLPGDEGLLKLLEQQGYFISPVE